MRPTTRLGLEEVLTRRAAAWTAAGVWAAGFVLAGATAERMSHGAALPYVATHASTYEPASPPGGLCDTRPADESGAAEDESTAEGIDAPAMFLPQDTLVVHATPAVGLTQMQSPP